MSDDTGRLATWEVIVCAALVLLAVVAHVPLMFLTAGGCDEWHILQIGANLRAGHVLYRDSNHISGPGSFYLAAGLFELFGERFEVGRIAMVVVFAVLVVATYCLARRLTGVLASVLVALWLIAFRLWTFPHFQMFHYATVGLTLVTLAFVVLHAEWRASPTRSATAGFLVGLAFITKQDSGALGAIACLAALLLGRSARHRAGAPREGLLPALALVVAASVPFLFTCAYFAWHGVLGDYLWQTVYDPLFVHPLLFASGVGPKHGDYTDLPPVLPLLGQDAGLRSFLFSFVPGLAWDLHWRDILESAVYRETNLVDLAIKLGFRLPFLVLLLETVSVVRGWVRLRDARGRARTVGAQAVQLVFAAAMLGAWTKPRDWIHLAILVLPFAPIVGRQLSVLVAALSGWPRRLFVGGLAAIGGAFAVASLALGVEAAKTYTAPVAGVRGTVWVRPEDATSFSTMIDRLATTPPDRPVLIVPCLPIATFLSDRPPLTRFMWLWQHDSYPDRDQRIIRRLEERPDASLIYVLMHMPFAPRPQVTSPELFEFLADRYQPVEVFGPAPDRMMCALGGPRAPADPASVRLTERLGEARAERASGGAAEAVPVESVAGVATWPLTPRVLHVTPGEGGESRVAIPVDVPAGAKLLLRAGVNPDLWQSLGPFPLRLRVEVVADGARTEVLSVEKDVYARAGDRLWTPLELDLAPWAGKKVEVVLAAEALGWKPGGREIAGFEDPRLLPATTAPPSASSENSGSPAFGFSGKPRAST